MIAFLKRAAWMLLCFSVAEPFFAASQEAIAPVDVVKFAGLSPEAAAREMLLPPRRSIWEIFFQSRSGRKCAIGWPSTSACKPRSRVTA